MLRTIWHLLHAGVLTAPPRHAEVPLEALADDENLAALEAGQEGEPVLDLDDLDSMDVTPKKKGKAKPKAPPKQGSKSASTEDAIASSSMQVRTITTPPAQRRSCTLRAMLRGSGMCMCSCGISQLTASHVKVPARCCHCLDE